MRRQGLLVSLEFYLNTDMFPVPNKCGFDHKGDISLLFPLYSCNNENTTLLTLVQGQKIEKNSTGEFVPIIQIQAKVKGCLVVRWSYINFSEMHWD